MRKTIFFSILLIMTLMLTGCNLPALLTTPTTNTNLPCCGASQPPDSGCAPCGTEAPPVCDSCEAIPSSGSTLPETSAPTECPVCEPAPLACPYCATSPAEAFTLAQAGTVVIETLKAKNMTLLASFVHPDRGLRVSPYAFVSDENVLLSQSELAAILSDGTIRQWGYMDGSGAPILKTFAEYYDQFIYNVDFANPQIVGYNVAIGQGNSIDNLTEYYPNAEFVEYHFKGFDPQYEGMDWQSLRLVFEKIGSMYYLVGLVHAQWTI